MFNHLKKDELIEMLDIKFKRIYERISAVMGRPRLLKDLLKADIKDIEDVGLVDITQELNDHQDVRSGSGDGVDEGGLDMLIELSAADWHKSGGLNLTTVEDMLIEPSAAD